VEFSDELINSPFYHVQGINDLTVRMMLDVDIGGREVESDPVKLFTVKVRGKDN
jgi:hypothetical protein